MLNLSNMESTATSNQTDGESYFEPIWTYTLPFQAPILFMTLFGNIMVCVVVYRITTTAKTAKIKSRSPGNMLILICNMACADLGAGLFSMPVSIALSIFPNNDLGKIPCMLQICALRLFFSASVFTMFALSTDRYLMIRYQGKQKLKLKIALPCIWVASLVSILMPIQRTENYYIEPYFTACNINFQPEDIVLQITDLVIITFVFLYGLISLPYLYIKIFIIIYNCMKNGVQCGVRSNTSSLRIQRKVATMLLACVTLFFLCWLPLTVYAAIIATPAFRIKDLPRWLGVSVIWMVHLQSAVNPLVYSICSKQLRNEFVATMKCAKTKLSGAFSLNTHNNTECDFKISVINTLTETTRL